MQKLGFMKGMYGVAGQKKRHLWLKYLKWKYKYHKLWLATVRRAYKYIYIYICMYMYVYINITSE